MNYLEKIKEKFKNTFQNEPQFLIKAPGRINLIGEHTDYNDGFVLPAAVDKAIYFAFSKRQDSICSFVSFDLNDAIEISLDDLKKTEKGWANYLIGAIHELKVEGYQIDKGVNIVFGGDVPLGGGMSSSAAIDSGVIFGMNELFDLKLSKMEMALIAQRTEHNFAGVKCGIMDMFASIHGKVNSVIKLDCRDLSYQLFPFESADYQIILCNTGVKHNLGDSEYNTRRSECEEGVAALKVIYPNVNSLRDASIIQLNSIQNQIREVVYKRCKYVIEEIKRVELACEHLLKNDLMTFGKFMYETHNGLQNNYGVSCKELDFLVDFTRNNENIIGSRMMGGGFGGCTINLVKNEYVNTFINQISEAYQAQFDIEMEHYEVALTDGVGIC
jgi:galactokinase